MHASESGAPDDTSIRMASRSVQYTVLRARVENRNLSALLARIAHIVIRDATCET